MCTQCNKWQVSVMHYGQLFVIDCRLITAATSFRLEQHPYLPHPTALTGKGGLKQGQSERCQQFTSCFCIVSCLKWWKPAYITGTLSLFTCVYHWHPPIIQLLILLTPSHYTPVYITGTLQLYRCLYHWHPIMYLFISLAPSHYTLAYITSTLPLYTCLYHWHPPIIQLLILLTPYYVPVYITGTLPLYTCLYH